MRVVLDEIGTCTSPGGVVAYLTPDETDTAIRLHNKYHEYSFEEITISVKNHDYDTCFECGPYIGDHCKCRK